jgi:hypothetical protein
MAWNYPEEVTLRGHPRPGAARYVGDRIKLHRHVVRLGGTPYTVITLRPGTDVRFSNNRHHETWHILSDSRGARLLGRLLWGLAYQRVPRTLVLIEGPQLDPNPFDAAPADPIALVPAWLTPLPTRDARELRKRIPLTRPAGTVRWHTPGLTAAAAAGLDAYLGIPWWWERRVGAGAGRHRVERAGGLLILAATPPVLRDWAVDVYRLGEPPNPPMDWTDLGWPYGMDYTDLGRMDGEVQIFADYRQRVSAARVARREVLAGLTRPISPADLEPLIWQRGGEVRLRARRPQRTAAARSPATGRLRRGPAAA